MGQRVTSVVENVAVFTQLYKVADGSLANRFGPKFSTQEYLGKTPGVFFQDVLAY